MFHLDDTMQYYLYPYPADMRKGFYTLGGIVTNSMKRNVQEGEVFIFINRTCNCMKVLHMECGGLVVYHLRLDSGTFKLPVYDEGTQAYHSTWQELMLMIRSISSPKQQDGTERK
jgi:transposase